MNIRKISFIIFFLPTFTVIISYFISLNLNLVPSCFPILDGCTSISRTGRYYPVNIFFKIFMFFTGFLMIFYWYKNYIFFKNINNTILIHTAYILGLISIFFLFLYLIFLGENNHYKYFRKIGIFIYILFSIISDLLLSIIYFKNLNNYFFNKSFVKYKLILSFCLAALGICLFPFMVMKIDDVANIRNIISWNYFLLIQISFLFTFFIWKKNNFN